MVILREQECQYLLEILEDRYGLRRQSIGDSR